MTEAQANAVMIEIEMYEEWARRKTQWYRDRAVPVLQHLYERHAARDQEVHKWLLGQCIKESSPASFDRCWEM